MPINIAINEEVNPDPENLIVDKDTGTLRPKQKKVAPQPEGTSIPKLTMNSFSDITEVSLSPKNWFLTQSSIMGCLPVENNRIPIDLVNYVNANFNTYPANDMHNYIEEFRGSLLFKNHNPGKAYGFVIDVKPREVDVKGNKLIYIDILTAVNRNIDTSFAEDIQDRKIKYMSFAHTSGEHTCAVCDDETGECIHIREMLLRATPKPAISKDGRPYGILHKHNPDFHVYEASYLDVRPAFDGAISNSITLLEKPLLVEVSKGSLLNKAALAQEAEDFPKDPNLVVQGLLSELNLD